MTTPLTLPTAYRAVAFDVDGTLVTTRSGNTFRTPMPTGARDRHNQLYHSAMLPEADWEWLPGRLMVLRALHQAGVRLAFVTNQGGVAIGKQKADRLLAEFYAMREAIGDPHVLVRMCTYLPGMSPEDPTEAVRRKPAPGMLFEVLVHFNLPRAELLYVGDRPEDQEAARAAGVAFTLADEFFSEVSMNAELTMP